MDVVNRENTKQPDQVDDASETTSHHSPATADKPSSSFPDSQQMTDTNLGNMSQKSVEPSGSCSTSKPDIPFEEEEYNLAKELRKKLDINLEVDASIMKDMGDTYHRRGEVTKDPWCYVKACALYNAAAIRTQDATLRQVVNGCIESNEKQMCELFGVSDPELPSVHTEDHKHKLCEIREKYAMQTNAILEYVQHNYSIDDETRVKIEREIIDKIQNTCYKITADMIEYSKSLITKAKEILGAPPHEFSILGLGSLARHEMTPYSDLEFIILTEYDHKKDYFRNLVHLLHIFVLNLGETQLPSVGIKSLNDFDKDGGHWFFDKIACCGFMFDGAAPWACKTPLGRPHRIRKEGDAKEGIEFIQTPEDMASFCQTDFVIKEGYNLAKIMMSVCVIDQSKNGGKLFDRFIEAREKLTCLETYKKHIFELAMTDVQTFSEKLSFHKFDASNTGTLHNIKQEIYRLPTLIVNSFKPLFGLTETAPWKILDEMCERSKLKKDAAHNLKVAVSIVTLLRLQTYNANKGQKETISLLKPTDRTRSPKPNETEKIAYDTSFKVLTLRCYMTFLPLTGCFNATLDVLSFEDYVKSKGYLDNILFENSDYIKGIFEYNCTCFSNARQCFARALKTEGINFIRKAAISSCIGTTELRLCNYDSALMYYNDALDLYKVIFSGSRKFPIPYTNIYTNIASVYFSKGDLDNAVKYLGQVSEILEQLFRDGNHDETASLAVALTHYNLGTVYNIEKGDLDNGLKNYIQAYKMQKKIHGDTYHSTLALSLCAIGSVLRKKCYFEQAMMNLRKSYEMRLKIHGDSNHCDIASSLREIGDLHHDKGDNDKALKYLGQAYEMMLQIYHGERNHSDIAFCLTSIASVYSSKGDKDEALKYHMQAYEIMLQIYGERNHREVYQCLANIGTVYYAKDDHVRALEYLMKSYNMTKEIYGDSDRSDVARCLNCLGKVYLAKGDHDNAWKYFTESWEMFSRIHGDRNHPEVDAT